MEEYNEEIVSWFKQTSSLIQVSTSRLVVRTSTAMTAQTTAKQEQPMKKNLNVT